MKKKGMSGTRRKPRVRNIKLVDVPPTDYKGLPTNAAWEELYEGADAMLKNYALAKWRMVDVEALWSEYRSGEISATQFFLGMNVLFPRR